MPERGRGAAFSPGLLAAAGRRRRRMERRNRARRRMAPVLSGRWRTHQAAQSAAFADHVSEQWHSEADFCVAVSDALAKKARWRRPGFKAAARLIERAARPRSEPSCLASRDLAEWRGVVPERPINPKRVALVHCCTSPPKDRSGPGVRRADVQMAAGSCMTRLPPSGRLPTGADGWSNTGAGLCSAEPAPACRRMGGQRGGAAAGGGPARLNRLPGMPPGAGDIMSAWPMVGS